MHSRSCWTCRGTSRHNLHSSLVDNGRYFDDRRVPPAHYTLVSDCFRLDNANGGLLLPSVRQDITLASVGIPRLREDWSYVMVRNRATSCGLDDGVMCPRCPICIRHRRRANPFPRQCQHIRDTPVDRDQGTSSLLFLSFRSLSLLFFDFFSFLLPVSATAIPGAVA